ncbi:MAG TPA: hypothetical protein VIY73_04280 [Polyangiaceae bacterium]
MDDWHRNLAKELVQGTPSGTLPDAAAAAAGALEISFGHARSAVTYVLELARAHRIPVSGSVIGDDVWMQLGEGRVRFTLNRRQSHVVVVRPGHDEERVGLGDADLGAMAREALDALVASWRKGPLQHRTPSAPPPEFEDEPTKG